MPKSVAIALGWGLSFMPLVGAALAVAFWLPDTIPLHFDFAGNITSWGPAVHEFALGGILAGANVLCALISTFAEPLFSAGVVNGVRSPRGARVVMLAAIIMVNVVFFVILGVQIAACQ